MAIRYPFFLATAVALLAAPVAAEEAHKIVTAQQIKWGPAPPSIPPGAQAAVLYGNPGKEGLFSLRLKLPKGYALAPHTHPKPEIVTVISGTFRLGMGEKADKSKGHSPAGGQLLRHAARNGALRLRRQRHGDPAQQHGSVEPHLHQPGGRPEEEMSWTASSTHRFDWLAGAATLLAIVACYGTLILIGALSLMGVTLALHEGAWAGVVSLLALLAALGVLIGYRRHRALAPLALAAVGTALILWVMFGRYHRLMELAGFAALVVAAVWDWRLKRAIRTQENSHGRSHP